MVAGDERPQCRVHRLAVAGETKAILGEGMSRGQ